ncbi:alpha/beta fold hydrolase [uncultured Nitratireductor sp.]|uniref:alpha/beta fold hydrolase n=1 Tax=uncultured Nitratireductor sp. TaxID=520953 RepID=UPI00263195A0|nr:alpha/beta fold hydrolase [uncultured Nitratireductor sp.]
MTGALYADDTGEGECALVLLHGFAGSHRVWEGVRKALPKVLPNALPKGLRIIAYDLPGHARSLGLPGAGRAKSVAQTVVDDLAARGIARYHLAGHSFGGAVAVLAAHLAPRSVASLVLIAPGGFGSGIAGDLMAARAHARTDDEIASAVQAMFGAQAQVESGVVEAAIELNSVPGQREKLIEISSLIVRDGEQGAFPRAMLEALAMPVHVAWGSRDAVLPPHQADGLPESFIVHRLPGLGHMLPEEAPAEIARIIAESIGAV